MSDDIKSWNGRTIKGCNQCGKRFGYFTAKRVFENVSLGITAVFCSDHCKATFIAELRGATPPPPRPKRRTWTKTYAPRVALPEPVVRDEPRQQAMFTVDTIMEIIHHAFAPGRLFSTRELFNRMSPHLTFEFSICQVSAAVRHAVKAGRLERLERGNKKIRSYRYGVTR